MRSKEFVINVPINIKINGEGDPEIDVAGNDNNEPDEELQQNPVMIPPGQQEIELMKSEQGKSSPYIDELLDDNDLGDEDVDLQLIGDPRKAKQ